MSLAGSERIYSKAFAQRGIDGIVKWDVLEVGDGERLRLSFESANAPRRQGVWLKCDGGIEVEGTRHASVDLWSDTAPKMVAFVCHSADGKLSVYNIWENGGRRSSQGHTSGMRVEELPNGRRYSCNDIGFDTAFDRIVFRIERE
jgi:hypothetical protein